MNNPHIIDNQLDVTELHPAGTTLINLLSIFNSEFSGKNIEICNQHPLSIPQPYRRLLVHSQDMTPTLEEFYNCRLGLKVLNRFHQENHYYREVLLVYPGGKPVEYGAIRIHLEWFSASLQTLILSESLPLGRILQDSALPHLSWPQGFFSITSTEYLRTHLNTDNAGKFYGRRNVLLNMNKRLLAEVVEILSPANSINMENTISDRTNTMTTSKSVGLFASYTT